jgi:GNAT superfamily N-acetyltransferase
VCRHHFLNVDTSVFLTFPETIMSPQVVKISRTTAHDPAFRKLIPLLDTELADRYGKEQETYDQFNFVTDIETVVIAFDENIAVGCGCFKRFDQGVAEIKRMFVAPQHRGKGIARQIVQALEMWAAELNYHTCILETGDKQPEAIALYERMGYRLVENFGPYKGMSSSICFSKSISEKISTS